MNRLSSLFVCWLFAAAYATDALAEPSVEPASLSASEINNAPHKYVGLIFPYDWSGGYRVGSAAVVKNKRIAISCAHRMYDFDTYTWLDPASDVDWYGKYHDELSPFGSGASPTAALRGMHVFNHEYSTMVQQHGKNSPLTLVYDISVLYSYENMADDAAPYLADGWSALESSNEKLISGFPVDYSANYFMHRTGPWTPGTIYPTGKFVSEAFNYLEANRVRSDGGNSGGPVWVKSGGEWKFAGILVSKLRDNWPWGIGVLAMTSYEWALVDAAIASMPPDPPSSLYYPNSSASGSYTVSWSSSPRATSYRLEVSSNQGASWSLVTTTSGTSHADTRPNGGYRYRVRAISAAGSGDWKTETYDCWVTISGGGGSEGTLITMKIPASKEGMVASSDPNAPYYGGVSSYFGWQSFGDFYTYVYFPIDLPSGTTAEQASLNLFVTAFIGNGWTYQTKVMLVEAHRVTQSWTQSVTWNTQPNAVYVGGEPWYHNDDNPSTYMGIGSPVRAIVNHWLAHGGNQGIMLRLNKSYANECFIMYANNGASSQRRPYLEIKVRESISSPTSISGPTSGQTGQSLSYSASGAASSLGHTVQYRFDWGDGTTSSWGSNSRSKTYDAAGDYPILVQARCQDHTSAVSDWSPVLRTVSITQAHTVNAPDTPAGPSTGFVGTSYEFSTSGSSCSHGHTVEYQFDWGDGQSGWGGPSAFKSYGTPNTYNVKARARCAVNTAIESGWSGIKSVTISPIPTYALNVTAAGASGVVITSSTEHGGTTPYSHSILQNTAVALEAPEYVGTGAARKRFSEWTGAVNTTQRAISFAMDAAKALTANYVDDPGEGGIVATPTFNPDGGSHPGSSVNVAITCGTAGATIRYTSGSGTTPGADPTTSSTAVPANGIVTVPVPGWLKAKAWKDGMTESSVKPAVYLSSSGQEDLYMVIDLSSGPSAPSYPVSYMNTPPAGGWTDEYKTTKLVMRKIPAGTFTMGSPVGELGRYSDEAQRQVTLIKDYYMGVFQVTQRQWELVMGNKPSYFNNASHYATRPAEQVNYFEIRENAASNGAISPNWPQSSAAGASSFVGKLRARTGLTTLDLPTEAQWERAARAGTGSALNSGKNLTTTLSCPNMSEVGRYWHNGGSGYTQGGNTSVGTAKVGSYLPNAWGLYDMHGNVAEWCLDWYTVTPPGTTDPAGAASGSFRVRRGGRWSDDARYCRSACRISSHPGYRKHNGGFRLSRTLPSGLAEHVLTVVNGTGGGAYAAGTAAAVTANTPPAGQVFAGWTVSPTGANLGTSFNATISSTKVTMPSHDVTLTAHYVADTTPPTVTITSPTSAATWASPNTTMNIGGTASANIGVARVEVMNARDGVVRNATVSTTTWQLNNLPLFEGRNLITVTAYDAAGNRGTDTITVMQGVLVPNDFDGDGKSDVSVFHPGGGKWYTIQSATGAARQQSWGWNATLPVTGDYDGDGKTDLAVYHPASGTWYIILSSNGSVRQQNWGFAQAVPVPGDYDGDGKTDLAVYHPASGTWYIILSSNGSVRQQSWGFAQAVPVPGDYDGDGKTDLAVYHPGGGMWYIIRSSNGSVRQQAWGFAQAVAVPADYDGDGRTDIAVYHPASGMWYIIQSATGSVRQQGWGWNEAVPVLPQYQINSWMLR